jgi:hypothetical protein
LELAADALLAAKVGNGGLLSFSSFKRAMGPAGPGKRWHHVVEQAPGNLGRFWPETIHNTSNLMPLETALHQRVSGFYSSTRPGVTGSSTQTVRRG